MDFNLDAYFDKRGMLHENTNIDELFDGHGHTNGPVESAVRDRMMRYAPHAASDLTRLFYAMEAQRKTDRRYPAKFFWK